MERGFNCLCESLAVRFIEKDNQMDHSHLFYSQITSVIAFQDDPHISFCPCLNEPHSADTLLHGLSNQASHLFPVDSQHILRDMDHKTPCKASSYLPTYNAVITAHLWPLQFLCVGRGPAVFSVRLLSSSQHRDHGPLI